MMKGKITAKDIAIYLNVSYTTVHRWCLWYEYCVERGEDTREFPHFSVDKNTGVRVWEASQETLDSFRNFKENKPKGLMADFHRKIGYKF